MRLAPFSSRVGALPGVRAIVLGRLALAAVLVLPGGLRASGPAKNGPADGRQAKVVRLLTVGNSFSQNATRFLGDLAAGAGHALEHRQLVVGGAPLALHWEKASRFEADPGDPEGRYDHGKSLRMELERGAWDFVTIQQRSLISADIGTYRPYARQLRDYIRQHAPCAEILMHQTWAYRCDDPMFAPGAARAGEPATREEMHRSLSHAYYTIAAELGLRVIPVGDAFALAECDSQWGFKPSGDGSPPKDRDLVPLQLHSLHVGWHLATGTGGEARLEYDGHHAGVAGEYLGSCVWFEVLYRESVVHNPFIPAGLDRAYALFLQETAHQAALGSGRRPGP